MTRVLFAMAFAMLTSCVQSPKGSVKELVSIPQPTFSGRTDINITTPSGIYTLLGECSMNSQLTQWSFDQITWTNITCVSPGRFSIPLNIISFFDIYARSARPGGFTNVSHARVSFANAPTTPQFVFVQSGNADMDSGTGTQNSIETTFTKATMSAGGLVIKQSLVDIIYE